VKIVAFSLANMYNYTIMGDNSLTVLSGVGPSRARALESAGIKNIWDLVKHFPRRYIIRDEVKPLASVSDREEATLLISILKKDYDPRRKRLYWLAIDDGGSELRIRFMNAPSWMVSAADIGDSLIVWGKVFCEKGYFMFNPHFEKVNGQIGRSFKIYPVYPYWTKLKAQGIGEKLMRRLVSEGLSYALPRLADPLPVSTRESFKLLPLSDAVRLMHIPSERDDVERARRRLAFQELLSLQTVFAMRRQKNREIGAPRIEGRMKARSFLKETGLKLTAGQSDAVKEILDDMSGEGRMCRLLEGDVGSGKTLVAQIAAISAIDSGYQVAYIVPNVVLAHQFYERTSPILDKLGISSAILTGSSSPRGREGIFHYIRDGSLRFIIGTQAVLSPNLKFDKLGLVVIDEQHRFGVNQRMELLKHYPDAHFLMMSATPIPRSVALSLYGDLDITVLKGFPAGRAGVKTYLRSPDALPKVILYLKQIAQKGEQAYIVYPIISESENEDMEAATIGFEHIKKAMGKGISVELVHGRIATKERVKRFGDFAAGRIQILVATSVVEVGFDVPNATVMVVENAERFGSAQLHQLRGRVGRGERLGRCILIAHAPPGSTSYRRLKDFAAIQDGFEIAKIDLEYRGEGKLFGNAQSGAGVLRFADPLRDGKMTLDAMFEAKRILESDGEERNAWIKYVEKKWTMKKIPQTAL